MTNVRGMKPEQVWGSICTVGYDGFMLIFPHPSRVPWCGEISAPKAFNEWCRYFPIPGSMSWYGEVSVLSDTIESYRYFPISGPLPGHGEISVPKGVQPMVQTYPHPRSCVWVWGSFCTIGYDGFMPIFPHSRSSPQAWGSICFERSAANGTDILSSLDLRLGMGTYLYCWLQWIHADISPFPVVDS